MKLIKTLFVAAAAMLAVTSCNQNKTAGGDDARQAEETANAADELGMPVVMDFNATWCGPCQQFAPVFEQGEKDYAGRVEFLSVDVDENPELAREYGVESIPTVVMIDAKGNELARNVGLMTQDEFYKMLDSNL